MKANQLPRALESEEQKALFEWAETRVGMYPKIRMMFHIPNGEKRDKVTAQKLKAMGVKPGVLDICLPVCMGGFAGMYLELKRIGEKPSPEQLEWMDALMREGYYVACCEGWEAAAHEIERYISGKVRREDMPRA